MSNYDIQSYTATGDGGEVVIGKNGGFLRISGSFDGTVKLQVQSGNDLESSVSTWIDVAEYTAATVQEINSPKSLRYRTSCTTYTSGTAVAELNG